MFSDRCDGCPCPTIRAHFLHPSRQCLAQPPLHAVYTNRGSDNTYATMLYVNSSLPCTELRPTANCCCLLFYMLLVGTVRRLRREETIKFWLQGISSEAAEVIWPSLWHAAGCRRAYVSDNPLLKLPASSPRRQSACPALREEREDNQPSAERGDQTARL